MVQRASGLSVLSEALAVDDDVSALSIRRSTPWVGSLDRVEAVLELIVVVVDSVPSHLKDHFVSIDPSSWRRAQDSGRVNKPGSDCLGRDL